jgi:hypothetical protein
MKTRSLAIPLALSLLLAFVSPALSQEIIYDNTTNDQNENLDLGGNEVGDEIIVGGTARDLVEFSFEYWGSTSGGAAFDANVEGRIRFYHNDGTPVEDVPGSARPSTIFYDSGSFLVDPTPRATLIFTNFLIGATVPLTEELPDTFTWSIEFSGLGAEESAGVTLYTPPTVGNNFTDYWVNDGSSWSLQTNSFPVDFAAQFIAVPEPSSFVLLGLGLGLAGLFTIVRRRARPEIL